MEHLTDSQVIPSTVVLPALGLQDEVNTQGVAVRKTLLISGSGTNAIELAIKNTQTITIKTSKGTLVFKKNGIQLFCFAYPAVNQRG